MAGELAILSPADLALRYEEVCRAVTELATVHEAKDFADRAAAISLYARQAKNTQLQEDAAEIRIRAVRRLGELVAPMEKNPGGRPAKTSNLLEQVSTPTLAEIGISRALSSQGQKLAAIPAAVFEEKIASLRSRQTDTEARLSMSALVKATRVEEHHRRRIEMGGCKVDDLVALAASGYRAAAIAADPGWKFRARSERGEDRSAHQHYTTTEMQEIVDLPVAALAAGNAALFLWMVDWAPRQALEVGEAWGFKHVTRAFLWAKTSKNGTGWHFAGGYWTRSNPEDCWLFTKGDPKRLDAGVPELIVAPVGEHSEKPDEAYERIERLVDGPYLELHARRQRKHWTVWGDEIDRRLFYQAPEPKEIDPPADEPDEMEIPAFLRRAAE